ncbi:type II secretion system F family protein [Streptomyces polyrhachis]|uniref:Type II secretion system F family protein n=1 Tax=Streptomyces polyrhachis TaxID=1282885 RepID=A0ABW2GBC5_9ACTN
MFLGPAVGGLVGAAVGYGVWRRLGTAGQEEEEDDPGELDSLPLAADLLAACLAAGAAPREAAREVGGALDGVVAVRLAQGAAELGLGGDPRQAWRGLAALPGAEGLALCLEQAVQTGIPVVEAVSRLAAESRAERARAAAARARRASVLVTGPLGLCFLPAFLAVGVAPVVLGLAAGLMGG